MPAKVTEQGFHFSVLGDKCNRFSSLLQRAASQVGSIEHPAVTKPHPTNELLMDLCIVQVSVATL